MKKNRIFILAAIFSLGLSAQAQLLHHDQAAFRITVDGQIYTAKGIKK